MLKKLITGAAGFLGSHLCDRFIAKGHHVIAMDNLITGDLKNIGHLMPLETLKTDDFYFWRNSKGNEMDIVIDKGIELIPVEIKSGETITKAYFKEMNYHLKSGRILLKALHARKFYPLEPV